MLQDRPRLVRDLWIHLREYRPRLLDIYPPAYLLAIIEDTIDIARDLALDDVHVMRGFLVLRWDIAPGFYKQPVLAAVLRQADVPAATRWALLAGDRYADAWLDAHDFDDAQEWRGRYWGRAA